MSKELREWNTPEDCAPDEPFDEPLFNEPQPVMNADGLLPCPFCGGKASVIDHHNDDGSVSVGCADDTCLGFSGLGWLYKTEDEAIKAWNTRYERTYKPIWDEDGLACDKCGYWWPLKHYDNGKPCYCPNCGAKVVEE